MALCRGRTDLLADAIRHRYALADAHNAYAFSLRSVGSSFHRFIDSAGSHEPLSSSSPVLPLPAQRKGDPLPPPPPQQHSRSHSGSGSHIQLHSSDDDEDGDSGSDGHDSHLHSENSSPNRYHFHQEHETLGPTFVNFSYARNQPQPSTVHFANVGGGGGGGGDPSSSASLPPSYPNYSNYPYSYPHAYPTNNYYGLFGNSSSSPPPNLAPPLAFGPAADSSAPSTSKPPPPPPSPPRVSTWDFLDPFGIQETYYPSYPPSRASRSSREVRDEEGIPDLEEEEEDVDEVVKEVYAEQKFVGSTSREYTGNEDGIGGVGETSRSVEVENEENVVEKKVVADDSQQQNVAASSSKPRKYSDISEIGSEIRVQFERASDAATELSKMLEVGKHPYRYRKSSVIEGEVSLNLFMFVC